ncbi:MAG: hypothetical protein GTO42_08630 [Candidatus Latescibacteria bacterium]|nr:hypothetical protein [Candidatus Latescibacterota bacterium]NIO29025.1 hypothetical protein [Candidatus Latescibacterota bacterium]NIO56650.1 hypothetical protein [Candidatus Latescibacterota bacterium]NIT02233.1 hypothetical protein [Candidatus Latescibacterota bacterium]NIT39118.1 hypothetical protein [Candidatus Latescibacterota bacterium]
MKFDFEEYMRLVRRKNPRYEKILRSSLHDLTGYLKKSGGSLTTSDVIRNFDKIVEEKRLKYEDALSYMGKIVIEQDLIGAPEVRPLIGAYGRNTTAKVIHDLVENYSRDIPGLGIEKSRKLIAGLLTLEAKNVKAVQKSVASMKGMLRGKGFRHLFDAYTLDEKKFNPGNDKRHHHRAALWICSASNTLGASKVGVISEFLKKAVRARKTIRSMKDVDHLYREIVLKIKAPDRKYRCPFMGSPLTSDKGGHALLEKAVSSVARSRMTSDLGCYLFGATIRCHGFTDGNGRIARALFALCQLRATGSFQPLSRQGEDKITGL